MNNGLEVGPVKDKEAAVVRKIYIPSCQEKLSGLARKKRGEPERSEWEKAQTEVQFSGKSLPVRWGLGVVDCADSCRWRWPALDGLIGFPHWLGAPREHLFSPNVAAGLEYAVAGGCQDCTFHHRLPLKGELRSTQPWLPWLAPCAAQIHFPAGLGSSSSVVLMYLSSSGKS